MNLPVILVLYVFTLITVSYGFLLENTTPAGNTVKPLSVDIHYLSEQLRDEKQLRILLAQRVAALEQKTGTQQQEDKINKLEQHVLTLESRVKFLEENQVVPVNETIDIFARSEIVKESGIYKQKFENVDKDLNDSSAVLESNLIAGFKKLEQLQNTSTANLRGIISGEVQTLISQLDEFDQRLNQTNASLMEYSRQVAVSSCIKSPKKISSGNIIKFFNVKMSSGVSDFSDFNSTGIFTCEYPGLYHVTVTMTIPYSDHINVNIMKNNAEYIRLYDEYSRGTHTSTAATTLTLDTNDTVYFKSAGSFYMYGEDRCCMSITKIK